MYSSWYFGIKFKMNVFLFKLDKQWNFSILEQELRNDLEFFLYLLLEIQIHQWSIQIRKNRQKKTANKLCRVSHLVIEAKIFNWVKKNVRSLEFWTLLMGFFFKLFVQIHFIGIIMIELISIRCVAGIFECTYAEK